jgi:ParB-like chromosome segregation protein Spo0J
MVEDVYPDQSNPRADFGDIDALAESFEMTPGRPGEPLNPPVVVEDGGIYRIVDGERRYRAIKRNKLKEMHVVVADDIDEAQSVAMMLATDDKRGLGEVERSRGVQTMLMLGVPVEKVEKVSRRKGLGRVKRAMQAVGDAAEDMSLERLAAIDELADVPGAAERLEKAGEAGWRAEAEAIRKQVKAKADMEAMLAGVKARGVEVVDQVPDGFSFFRRFTSPKDVEGKTFPEGSVTVGSLPPGAQWAYLDVYAPAGDEKGEDAAAKAERDALVDEWVASLGAFSEDFLGFVKGRLHEPRLMPNLSAVANRKLRDFLHWRIEQAEGEFGKIPADMSPMDVAIAISQIDMGSTRFNASTLADSEVWPEVDGYEWDIWRWQLEAAEAAVKDGWKPGEQALKVLGALEDMSDARDGGEEQDDE